MSEAAAKVGTRPGNEPRDNQFFRRKSPWRKPSSTHLYPIPNRVPEILAVGPFNINVRGPLTTITFTHVRSKFGEVSANPESENVEAIVVARIVLPTDGLGELRNVLNNLIKSVVPGSSARN